MEERGRGMIGEKSERNQNQGKEGGEYGVKRERNRRFKWSS